MHKTGQLYLNNQKRLYVKKMVNNQLRNVYLKKRNMKAVNAAVRNYLEYVTPRPSKMNIAAMRNYLMVKRGASLPPYNSGNKNGMVLNTNRLAEALAQANGAWHVYRGGAGRANRVKKSKVNKKVNKKGREILEGPQGGLYVEMTRRRNGMKYRKYLSKN